MKTAEEMKKQISLFVEYKDHDRVILSNANGDTFSSKSEDLIDFLHGIKDSQASSELPSDEEIETLAVKRYRGENLDEQKRNSKLILAFEDGMKQMRSIAIASHVARIKELKSRIKTSEILSANRIKTQPNIKMITACGMFVVNTQLSSATICKNCGKEKYLHVTPQP